MASLGHIAVGMAAARILSAGQQPSWTSVVVWSGLSMLPDADVVGLPLGVAYEGAWGHRGATHSIAFACAVAGVVAFAAPKFGLARRRTFAVAAAVLSSHPLLDTLTDGGLGCALWWPFDPTRYFAPWRPIPVSPIGLEFFSPYGGFVAATELIVFGPVFRFAWSSASQRGARVLRGAVFWTVWIVLVWLIASTDPVRQRVLGAIFRERTEYSERCTGAQTGSGRDLTPGSERDRADQCGFFNGLGRPTSQILATGTVGRMD